MFVVVGVKSSHADILCIGGRWQMSVLRSVHLIPTFILRRQAVSLHHPINKPINQINEWNPLVMGKQLWQIVGLIQTKLLELLPSLITYQLFSLLQQSKSPPCISSSKPTACYSIALTLYFTSFQYRRINRFKFHIDFYRRDKVYSYFVSLQSRDQVIGRDRSWYQAATLSFLW